LNYKLQKFITNDFSELANKTKSEKEINSTHISYYKIRMYVSSCKYWHTKAKEWRTDGCEVNTI
jgi:hypothetical protein